MLISAYYTMVFVNIGTLNINCQSVNLCVPFNTLTLMPNQFSKLVSRCLNLKTLQTNAEDCAICVITDVVSKKNYLEINCQDSSDNVEGVTTKKMKLNESYSESSITQLKSQHQECADGHDDVFQSVLVEILKFWFGDPNCTTELHWTFRKLLPKNVKRYFAMYELVVYRKHDPLLTLVTIPVFSTANDSNWFIHKSYGWVFNENEKMISGFVHQNFDMPVPDSSLVATKTWITDFVFPKLKRMGESKDIARGRQFKSLVNIEKYGHLYSKLKEKYASYLISIWSENTDPLKFVYEDIAIATYILLLWEEERYIKNITDKQSFIDLECGNGLIVHILTNEGHAGKGIDIVKQKIWDNYGGNTILEESRISPHQHKVDVDWIIGTHADELAPWIPIIAARSSYFTNYFVLPCCPYDFNKKFDGVSGLKSKYLQHLEYIVKIGQECGFCVEEDRLKIPSPKQICSIGRHKRLTLEEHSYIDFLITDILNRHSFIELEQGQRSNFAPIKINKDPKHCKHIDMHIKQKMVDMIINRLLSKENISYCLEDKLTSSGDKWSEWNAGDCISISEFAQLFDQSLLENLKVESGGLISLIKSQHRIFKVMDDMVSLRDFRKSDDLCWGMNASIRKSKTLLKTRGCWFYKCHPQGCLLTAEECSYAHGGEDMHLFNDKL